MKDDKVYEYTYDFDVKEDVVQKITDVNCKSTYKLDELFESNDIQLCIGSITSKKDVKFEELGMTSLEVSAKKDDFQIF